MGGCRGWGGALCGERWGFAPRAVRGLLTELPGPSRPHSPSGPPRAPSAPPQEPLRTPSIPSRAPRAPSGAPRHPLHPFRSPSRAPQHSQHPLSTSRIPSAPPAPLPEPLSTPRSPSGGPTKALGSAQAATSRPHPHGRASPRHPPPRNPRALCRDPPSIATAPEGRRRAVGRWKWRGRGGEGAPGRTMREAIARI